MRVSEVLIKNVLYCYVQDLLLYVRIHFRVKSQVFTGLLTLCLVLCIVKDRNKYSIEKHQGNVPLEKYTDDFKQTYLHTSSINR